MAKRRCLEVRRSLTAAEQKQNAKKIAAQQKKVNRLDKIVERCDLKCCRLEDRAMKSYGPPDCYAEKMMVAYQEARVAMAAASLAYEQAALTLAQMRLTDCLGGIIT